MRQEHGSPKVLAVVKQTACSTLIVLGIASCGGGSDGAPVAEAVEWEGNANGEIIKDLDDENFVAEADSRRVLALDYDRFLSLTVENDGGVVHEGRRIADVIREQNPAGDQIARFRCVAGHLMDIRVDAAGDWAHNCNQAPGPAPEDPSDSPSVTTNPNRGEPVPHCASIQSRQGVVGVANLCQQQVRVAYCYQGDPQAVNYCGRTVTHHPDGTIDYSYGTLLLAPEEWVIFSLWRNSTTASLFACSVGASGLPSIPVLTGWNPPEGKCL